MESLLLGVGVVGDLAGFAASTYMRGISLCSDPDSLTAQVDSSIGGKTGVNTALQKHGGTFAQPDGVFIDPEVLSTLGQRELIGGDGRSHQVRPSPSRYGTLGRIGSHGWFCPEYFRACREHHFSFLPGEAETMWWQMSWTMAFACISTLGILWTCY